MNIHNTIGLGRSHIYSLGHVIKETYCLENPQLLKLFSCFFIEPKLSLIHSTRSTLFTGTMILSIPDLLHSTACSLVALCEMKHTIGSLLQRPLVWQYLPKPALKVPQVYSVYVQEST